LIGRWLSVAELELITTVNYESYIERIIRSVLGGLQLREIQDRVEVLDELYAPVAPVPQAVRGPAGPGGPPAGRPGQAAARRRAGPPV
jgi:hypothetical protein